VKVVFLAGGLGTRLLEETEYRRKPIVEKGECPIIWHIMKNFGRSGLEHFAIAALYRGGIIS